MAEVLRIALVARVIFQFRPVAWHAPPRGAAVNLRRWFNRDVSLPKLSTFALTLDDPKRPIDGLTSNSGHSLWSGIAEPAWALAVADRLLSKDLLHLDGHRLRACAAARRPEPIHRRVDMPIEDRYHGQQIQPGGQAKDAPPMPQGRHGYLPEVILHGHSLAGLEPSDIRRFRAAGTPEPRRTYAHVRMTGNYNLGCIDTQTLDYYDITPARAHQLAWDAFGSCVHVIAYFDENEQLVAGE